jgi:hypothetical protein
VTFVPYCRHEGWVTSIATPLDNSDILLSSSRDKTGKRKKSPALSSTSRGNVELELGDGCAGKGVGSGWGDRSSGGREVVGGPGRGQGRPMGGTRSLGADVAQVLWDTCEKALTERQNVPASVEMELGGAF